MLLELHIIQNFAPSNLNRDDTGSPKSCEFGGYRRARISSQSIKRAIRGEFVTGELLPAGQRATRSKRFVDEVARRLVAAGRDAGAAPAVAEAGLALLDIKLAKEQKTEYLLFLGEREVAAIAAFCSQEWDSLAAATEKKGKKDTKDEATRKLAAELAKSLDGGKAADLALFGRMLADLPERNIDAASQVAHAISTHQVSSEFDYYTAVDDLKPDDTAGADMIGTVEFNSACFYRYANIDIDQLSENLGGDRELVEATLRAFLLASRDAIPTGKQNSFAARNAPSFFCTVVRDRGAWSLANAFADPVRAGRNGGLIDASITALDAHWGELVGMYGAPAGAQVAVAALGKPALEHLKGHRVETFDALLERTLEAARPGTGG
ncbi:MAG: type I-E CRISPR-associated protein Cas7/Cse4/CasC [Chloroflexi bacterium]|nr:type I-E CRISPR-associated protein Cas7/Cse4/CasC [Chloroflexota bacterium]